MDTIEKVYDYIVVGAGSAGSVAAAELAKVGTNSVLLLDAGASPEPIKDVWDPYLNNNLYGKDGVWWRGYKSPKYAGTSEMTGVPRSKLFGGCSSVNDMVYSRGAEADYNRWENLYKCYGWSAAEVKGHFEALEKVLDPTICHEPDEFGQHFLEACSQQGLPLFDYNSLEGPMFGVSPLRSTISPRTIRETTFQSFILDSIIPQGNLKLEQGTCSKVLFDANKAVGIEYIPVSGGELVSVVCKREVILSAGAINSPKILLSSGIGDPHYLASKGIPLVARSPQVGKNLQDQTIFSLSWATNTPLQVPRPAPNGNRRNEGFAIAWANLDPDTNQPKNCVEMMPGLYVANQTEEQLENNFTITGGGMRLQSRGTVELADGSDYINAPPKINLNRFAVESDMAECVAAFKFVRSLAYSPAFGRIRGPESASSRGAQSPSEIEAWLKENSMSYSHPSCTCAMGPVGSGAVVDPTLKVIGTENLRVMDASVMPEITSGHTQAPSFMIGHKGASMILGK
ncbi:MAG: GMC family oxidoreductase N-terminal domain-containing protein [SAR324 cluster bacterium]|nr:GMC family oxidoreductase N-terminal domain-containing protein [SAR324 cluster bacterium]